MHVQTQQTIQADPSLPPTPDIADLYPGYYCACPRPLPIAGGERHGAEVAYCARCEHEVARLT
jgi:hypothetical protein